jgi:catechol 2,3 dioxygenase
LQPATGDGVRYVFVCQGLFCGARGSQALLRELEWRLAGHDDVVVERYWCFNDCSHGPNVVLASDRTWYEGVGPSDVERIVRHAAEAIRFIAPREHQVELYYDMRVVGNGLPTTNPDPYPDGLVGIHPPRMDHTLLTTPDTSASFHFWNEIMGFRLTEQVAAPDGTPIAVWLERTHSPHDLAFIPGNPGGMHHFAFWLDDWSEIGRAADVIVRGGATIDAGPTRHGITRGHTIYFFDPSGNCNEVFTGGYYADPKMEPITWTADKLWQGIFYWDRVEKGAFVANYT